MKIAFSIFSLLLLALIEPCLAEEFQFFDKGIDYWGEENPKEAPRKREAVGSGRKKSFDWDKYMDPENDEFFKEGNYTPPAPFMEFYRRPTKENTLKWDAYIKKRNQIHKRALLAAKKYLPQVASPSINREFMAKSSGKNLGIEVFKGKWLVFYFDKNCPHCSAMYPTINRLAMSGVNVQAVRLDPGKGIIEGLNIPWQKVKPDEKKKMKIGVTPTLLVIDDANRKVTRIEGNRSIQEIINATQAMM